VHRTLRRRPIDLLAEERQALRPLPERAPDTARRWVLRVPPDPHVRVDTNDYSLDPALVGRRVEIRVDEHHVTAVAWAPARWPAATSAALPNTRPSRHSSTPAL
jgi:hypothetical protein